MSGSLPSGLSLDANTGIISGTPTTIGNFDFQVQVTGSNNQSSTANFSIVVSDGNQIGNCSFVGLTKHPYTDWGGGGWHYLEGLSLGYNCASFDGNYMAFVIAVSKTCSSLNGCSDIQYYPVIMRGSGFTRADQVFISLPTPIHVLQLYANTGSTMDWDSTTGRFRYEVSFRDFSSSLTGGAQIPFFLDLYTPAIITSALPDGTVDNNYSATLAATGGYPPFSWSIFSGTLPGGLTLNSSTGAINGVPTEVGRFDFRIQASDSNNQTAIADFSIQVHGNTPIGNNIQVALNNATVTYSNVTQEGQTTVTQSSSGAQPPSGFKLGTPPTYHHVSTTAQFSGQVEVCLYWQQGQFNNEQNLKLFHYDGTNWTNITESGYPDTINNIICGLASSFSDFAIFEKKQVQAIIDIKPGSYPNTINLGSNGSVPVAILSTSEFNATTIDPLSATLASAPIKLKSNGTLLYSYQDVNGDGLLDMIVHVSTQALQLTTSDQLADFLGYASDNTEVIGNDSVRVIQN